MLHHVSVGVSDVARAAKFYDAGAQGARLQARRWTSSPYAIGYGDRRGPEFWIGLPHDQQAAERPATARMSASARATRRR